MVACESMAEIGTETASAGRQHKRGPGGRRKIDWEAGKVMFARGSTYPEIAAYLGTTQATVKSRAQRYGWREERRRADRIARETASEVITREAESSAEAWSQSMIQDLHESAQRLRETPYGGSLSDLKMYEEVRKLHVETGRRLFGLDKSDNQTLVQVNLGDVAGQAAIELGSEAAEASEEAAPEAGGGSEAHQTPAREGE